MSVRFVKQDLTTSDADYICHQVNCMGKMNSGVAKAIREKWPIVFESYIEKWQEVAQHNNEFLLGDIQIVPLYNNYYETEHRQYVVNMFAQYNYGYDGKRYTSYDAFWSCLGHIREVVPKGSRVAFPYKIGCDRGGGCWSVILTMICEVLEEDYNIEFYYLNEDTWLLRHIIDTEWEGK